MTDIYKRIKQDHDKFRDMIEQIKATSDHAGKKRQKLFDTFKLELWSHAKIEEATFYTKLEQKGDTKEALEGRNEHHMAGALLDELDTMPSDNPEWSQKFLALSELLDHHMEEEETEFFKLGRKDFTDAEAEDLGDRFDSRKKVMVPALEPVE